GDPADQRGAYQAKPRKAVEHLRDQSGADDDDGNGDDEAENDQGEIALGGGGDGDGVVETHDGIGDDDRPDRRPDILMRLDVGGLLLLDHQLDADPQQQHAPDQLQLGHAQP